MTEQQITVTKIEPHPRFDGWWIIHSQGFGEVAFSTDAVLAMGLTIPNPPLTVTIGEHTATINRDDAEKWARIHTGKPILGPCGRTAVALADLIRTALKDTDG